MRFVATTPFNADLYTVAATVIPVLFVALMLPGGILARYSLWTKNERSRRLLEGRKRALRETRATTVAAGEPDPGDALPLLPSTRDIRGVRRLYGLQQLPVSLFMTFAGVGEVCSVLALDSRHATVFEHLWTRDALVVLPIITFTSAIVSVSLSWALASDRPDKASTDKDQAVADLPHGPGHPG